MAMMSLQGVNVRSRQGQAASTKAAQVGAMAADIAEVRTASPVRRTDALLRLGRGSLAAGPPRNCRACTAAAVAPTAPVRT